MKKSKKNTPKGLGDVVETVARVSGVKSLVEAIVGDDCGCEERRKALNARFPFKEAKMSEDDKLLWTKHFSGWKTQQLVTSTDQRIALDIWNRSSRPRRKFSRCSPCVRNLLEDLTFLFNNSCEEAND